MADVQPFHLSTVLSNLYNTPDLVDLSAAPSSPTRGSSPQPTSLFASAASIAAAAGRRAAAVTSTASSAQSIDAASGRQDAQIEIRCVEGYGDNLYIGRSDGIVEWWTCDAASTSKHQGWVLKRQHTLFPRRSISRIVLLPQVQRAFILSEGTLHPLALPNLDTLPSTVIQPLRGIISVVLNDEELEWGGEGEMTMVVVRRSGLGIYRVGQRLVPIKEIPLPSAPSALALTSKFLCAALPLSGNYALIDLSDASLTEVLPISQTETENAPSPNVVVIPGETEFLVSSFTGTGSMGVFLNGQGDPVRGTLEWPDHPLSIAIESGYILALLQNQTVAIHSLDDLEKPAQAIMLDNINAFTLSYSPYGISIRDRVRDQKMANVKFPLLGARLGKPNDPTSGSGLTPPSSPQPAVLPFSTTVAETLIVGPDGLQALFPTPVLLRLEQLCHERRLDEAAALVDEERRKGKRGEIEGDKAIHQATLRLLHLYLACHLFQETMFEKAGDYFIRGKVDPRLLVRLFPTFRGKVIGSSEEIEVLQGLRGVLEEMPSIDEIISSSISRNYSPHVLPSTSKAPETTELANALNQSAITMLLEVLRKTRQSRRKGGGGRGVDSRKIDVVIDTTFAKLLAEAGITNELLALLAGTNDVVLAELEPFLQKRPYVLATVMRQQGRSEQVLEILQKIAEGEEDPLCHDPIDEIAQQLDGVTDPEVFRKYTLWLAARAPDAALNLLFAQNMLNDVALLSDLRAIDPIIADKYLEHAVVIRKSPIRELHEQLLEQLLVVASKEVSDEGVRYHLEELDAEYRLSESRPFAVFLADVAPTTPIKMVRLKLILFLQGSPFYDLAAATMRIEKMPALKTEMAIILGRQGQHKRALRLLALDVGDFVSAQAYCTQGGEIIPPKIAHLIAAHVPELAGWATLGDVGRKRRGTVDAKIQESLVMDLLGVYMQDEKSRESTARQGAALLNAQAIHLDMLDIIKLIPDEWPLDVVSTFFKRGLRRELHDKASWQTLKAISAGQNLQTSEAYLERLSEFPPVTATGPSPMSLPDEGSIAEKEYGQIEVEKDDGFFSPEIVNKELEKFH